MTVLQTGLAKSAATGYDIEQSLRWNETDDPGLTKTFSGTYTNKFTLSFWFKVVNTGVTKTFISSYKDAYQRTAFTIESDDTLYWYSKVGASPTTTYASLGTTRVFRDVGSWYHVVLTHDGSQGTDSNKIRMWINGEEETVFTTDNRANLTSTNGAYILNDQINRIGESADSSSTARSDRRWDGYLAEFHALDDIYVTDASSFGETDSATNQWKPIEYTGSYGTNGFYQKYSSTELAASFTDSAEGHAVTANGNVHTDTSVKKIGTASAQFDGTGDYLSSADSSDWALMAKTAYTIEAWIYPTSVTGTQKLFVQSEDGSNDWNFYMSGQEIALYCSSGGSAGARFLSASTPITINTWQHVALVRDGDDYELFVAGSSVATATSSVSDTLAASLVIGSDASGQTFVGYMDEIRISDSVRYTTTFTPSTTAFTNDANTMLLLHCDGSDSGTTFTDSSTRPRHTITANGDVTNTRAQYKIGDSSIKFDGTGDSLSLSSAAGNDLIGGSGSWTIEGWVRWTSGSCIFMEQGDNNERALQIWIQSDGDIQVYLSNTDGSWDFNNVSGSTLTADTWTHLALVKNSSAITLYKDGVADSVIDGSTTQSVINNSSDPFYIGIFSGSSSSWNGYMDEIRISDSARYTTTFTPSTTAFVADANTKLLIHSDFNGGLGADSSGNKNDFTPTNLVATDQMIDTPTNNYCTLNPLDVTSTGGTYSEGNLKFTTTSAGTGRGVSTFRPNSGKWYGEFYVVDATRFSCGVMNKNGEPSSQGGLSTDSAIFFYNKNAYYNGAEVLNYLTSTLVNGDIISFALDLDNTILWYGINGVWQQSATEGEIEAGTSTNSFTTFISSTNPISSDVGIFIEDNSGSAAMSGVANFGQDSSFAGNKTAQGNGGTGEDFYYTPPTGFVALNTDNLSDPAIALPTDHFNTILYTGNGGTQALTGVGFAPDLFWNKNRTGTYQHMLYDTIRGVTKYLTSGERDAEATDVNSLTAFDSDGVTLGSAGSSNATGVTSVGWNWKAGGAAASNTDGTITSSVSANTTAGFSIVSYTGNGVAGATVGHGLSQVPDLWIVKQLTGADFWPVGATHGINETQYLQLNVTTAAVTYTTLWNDTAPTSSVITLGTAASVNSVSAYNYIAYCFHSVEGYSKVGSYTGNGSTDGAFVYLGFRPAYILVKKYSATDSWEIFDDKRPEYNQASLGLYADTSGAELTGRGGDFVSNGFKTRNGNGTTNESGSNYIYLAFAESPFKTSNAR